MNPTPISRSADTPNGSGREARIVSRVRVTKAAVGFSICTEDGRLAEEAVPRRDRGAYARMRRAAWGDALDLRAGEK